MNPFIRVVVTIIVIWLCFFLTALLHEMGHMLGYILAAGKKTVSWHITVGSGKQLLKTKRFTIRLIPFSGYFQLSDTASLTKKSALVMLAGGPIVSLLMTIACLVSRNTIFADQAITFALYCNVFQFPFHHTSG